jgi:hypothetical protein
LLHEVGHMLGFHEEPFHPDATGSTACLTPDPNLNPVSGYDPTSTMHGGYCGVGPILNLSTGDKLGVQYVYGIPWEDLGGGIKGKPAICSRGTNKVDVIARGSDDRLWWKRYSNGWSAWIPIGGPAVTGPPGAACSGVNAIDVAVRGASNQLLHFWHDGSCSNSSCWWSESLGGALGAGQVGVTSDSDQVDIFVRWSDNTLRHKRWNNGGWNPFWNRGGNIASGPAAVSWGQGRFDVVARGPDDAVWHWIKDNTNNWEFWESLGGGTVGQPGVSSWGPNRLDVFAHGTDNRLYVKTWASAWGTWASMSGMSVMPTGGEGASAVSWGQGRIDLVVRGPQGQAEHAWRDPADGMWKLTF